MEFFTRCQECPSVAAFKCTHQTHSALLCRQHVANFLEQYPSRDIEQITKTLGDTENLLLRECPFQWLTAQVVQSILQTQQQRTQSLLQQLAAVHQESTQLIKQVTQQAHQLMREVQAMLHHQLLSWHKPNSFGGILHQLESNNNLRAQSLQEEFTRLLTTPGFLEVAHAYGKEYTRKEDAVEFLCSQHFVFDSVKNPALDCSSLNFAGKDLSGGVFIGTAFTNAVLRQTQLHNTILWKTDLRGSDLTAATLTPSSIQTKWQLWEVAYSLCGKYVVFGGRF